MKLEKGLSGNSLLLCLLAVLVLQGCAPAAVRVSAPVTVDDIGPAQTWGGIDNVVAVKHLYISAQPDTAALLDARAHDVGVVISLREPSETEWDEAQEAGSLGMAYYNVPVPASGPELDQSAMEDISALVREHRDQKILLHCSSGNRAAAWFAVHLVVDHGMDIEPSIALARKAGLTKPGMEARVRNYLGAGGELPE